MAAPARSEPYRSGVLISGKYRLAERLGVGAMGTVWSAVNVATHGRVALKLIERPENELRLRLVREARLCAAIDHRNVVRVFDVGQSDSGDPFLVMELLRGDTLGALLSRRRNLAQDEVVALGRDIARGLAAAHEQGIVHRDLKPANIFLQEQPGEDAPVVKLLDFGVGKSLTSSDGLRTIAGGAIGSPVYMSPEQARGEPDVDFRADLWSLGVVLYEMLTGERPFSGESTDVLFKVMHAAAPRVSHRLRRVDPDIDDLVAACLTRDRTQRPASAAAIAAQLEARMASGVTAYRAPPAGEGGVMAAAGAPAGPAARSPSQGPTASGMPPRSSAGPESQEAGEDDDVTLLLEVTGPSAAMPAEGPQGARTEPPEREARGGPECAVGADGGGAPVFAPGRSVAPPAPPAVLPVWLEYNKSSSSATGTAPPCAVQPAGAEPRRGGLAAPDRARPDLGAAGLCHRARVRAPLERGGRGRSGQPGRPGAHGSGDIDLRERDGACEQGPAGERDGACEQGPAGERDGACEQGPAGERDGACEQGPAGERDGARKKDRARAAPEMQERVWSRLQGLRRAAEVAGAP